MVYGLGIESHSDIPTTKKKEENKQTLPEAMLFELIFTLKEIYCILEHIKHKVYRCIQTCFKDPYLY